MKFLALLLVIYLFVSSSISACFGNQEEPEERYESGTTGVGLMIENVVAKVESDERCFDKNNVNLDFSYSFYCLNDTTIDSVGSKKYKDPWYEDAYAIYLSKNPMLVFEEDEITDYENKVNAKLYKYFSFDDILETDYGYTHSAGKVNYNHSEKLTIPEELFDSTSGYVYVYVIRFLKDTRNETAVYTYFEYDSYFNETISIKYELTDDNKVVLK